jgi:hypothetical protein
MQICIGIRACCPGDIGAKPLNIPQHLSVIPLVTFPLAPAGELMALVTIFGEPLRTL